MGSMVGSDGSDGAIGQRTAQSLAVEETLHGRVALYTSAQRAVVNDGEQQMGHCSLARDVRAKQAQLLLGRDVGNMQAGIMAIGQLYCQLGRFQTHLLVTNEGMELHVGVVSARQLLIVCGTLVYELRIFAVCHQRQSLSASKSKNVVENLLAVNKHVSRAGAHEELYARNAVHIELAQFLKVVVGSSGEEGIVDMHALGSKAHLLLPSLEGCGLGNGIRHFEDRRHTARKSSETLGLHVGLVGHSRLAEMHVSINNSRQHISPRSVYLTITAAGILPSRKNGSNPVIRNNYISLLLTTLIYNDSAPDYSLHFTPVIIS